MAILSLSASGASSSTGSAAFVVVHGLKASGTGTFTGHAEAILSEGLRVDQVFAQVDIGGTTPIQVDQAFSQGDFDRTTPINVDQAFGQAEFQRTTPINVDQAFGQAEFQRTTPLNVDQVFLNVDARLKRERTETGLEFHVTDRYGLYLGFLSSARGKAYLAQLNEVGSGQFTISGAAPDATDTMLTIGNIVQVRYNNVAVGAWVMERIDEDLVSTKNEGEKEVVVSGRGLLSLLEAGIVYASDPLDHDTAERSFSNENRATIFLDLYEEYQIRGGGDLITGFTKTTDTDGVAWTDSNYLKYRAGQTLLSVMQNLTSFGLDVIAHHDGTLRAYDSAGVDRSATFIFRQGLDIFSAKRHKTSAELANAIVGLGQASTMVEETDATSIANFGRHETLLQVQNTATTSQITAAAQTLLAQRKDILDSLEVTVSTGVRDPLLDYSLGDTVQIEIPGQVSGAYRILSIQLKEIGEADLEVTLEVNSVEYEYLVKLAKSLAASLSNLSMNAGSSGGLASGDTRNSAAVGGHTHTESDITDLEHDAEKIQGRDVSADAPDDGDALLWSDGDSEWAPAAVVTEGDLHDEVTLTGKDYITLSDQELTLHQLESDDIGAGEVQSGNIANDAISSSHLQANSVGASELQDDSVGNGPLASNAVEEENIKDGEVTEDKLAEDYFMVDGSKVGDFGTWTGEVRSNTAFNISGRSGIDAQMIDANGNIFTFEGGILVSKDTAEATAMVPGVLVGGAMVGSHYSAEE